MQEALGDDYMALLANHESRFNQMLSDWSVCETKVLHDLAHYSSLWHQDVEETNQMYYQAAKECGDRLTRDIQKMEIETEKIKCSSLLSNSILDYNCQVLQIRIEENTAKKSQLQRQIRR